jgi:TIR domain
MGHDVFISHAHKDKNIADAICKKLESAQLRCWMTARDISASEDRTETTRNAIGSSRVMVLVLSENANAAPHIEREIAHAFYTRRTITAFRLSNTLPRRDFLFYLGNASWFDASGPDPEQHLQALTSRIKGLVPGRAATGNARLPQGAVKTRTPLNFLSASIGALRASHYRTLGILKWVTIAAFLFAVAWFLWFAPRQKGEVSSVENNLGSMDSGAGASPDSLPQARGDSSVSKPTYTFTRFGLWEPANSSQTPLVQHGPQDTPSTSLTERAASATPPRHGRTLTKKQQPRRKGSQPKTAKVLSLRNKTLRE